MLNNCSPCSPHPYIFFNQGGESLTFVGFTVDENGDLINPINRQIIQQAIMTKKLYFGLLANKVNFKDDYHNWKKPDMVKKICTVMGIAGRDYDPDKSYVLTVDNVIKILAIQMRFRYVLCYCKLILVMFTIFRCNIPVVIMGETGCGKTRLIRYMCDLARQDKTGNNMLILKVRIQL